MMMLNQRLLVAASGLQFGSPVASSCFRDVIILARTTGMRNKRTLLHAHGRTRLEQKTGNHFVPDSTTLMVGG